MFAGEKGDDEFFLRTQLKNGWTVSSARVIPMNQSTGINEVNAALTMFGGAYIQQQPSGSNPYFSVRWWLNPFQPYFLYRMAVEITGPEGIPDGIEVL